MLIKEVEERPEDGVTKHCPYFCFAWAVLLNCRNGDGFNPENVQPSLVLVLYLNSLYIIIFDIYLQVTNGINYACFYGAHVQNHNS